MRRSSCREPLRFPGLYIPILDFSFNGPAPTDTQFDTVEIAQQYDGFTDFPLYPLNLVADLNAVLGIVYVHAYLFDVSLSPDPTKPPPMKGKHGDTSYYFFENPDLPLFGPLRTLGVPEPVIDVVEPFFREIVELGYDRSIKPWEPTPARLIPPLNPATVATDLIGAIGEGIDNAAELIGSPLSLPAAATTAGEQVVSASDTSVRRVSHDEGGYVSGAERGRITAPAAARGYPSRSPRKSGRGRSKAAGVRERRRCGMRSRTPTVTSRRS
jgi:PE-PPE domain